MKRLHSYRRQRDDSVAQPKPVAPQIFSRSSRLFDTTAMAATEQNTNSVPYDLRSAPAMPPLRDPKKQIRLFRYTSDFPLSPSTDSVPDRFLLEVFDIERCPAYTALSYEWGDPRPPRTILVEFNGSSGLQAKSIRDNLHQFLGRLLYKDLPKDTSTWRSTSSNGEAKLGNKLWPQGVESQWLWADSICINQQNLSERSSQVAMMSEIFSKASHVIAWLGDDVDLATRLYEFCDPHKAFDISLFRCSFWSRLWCQQEVCLAQNLVLMAHDHIEVLKNYVRNYAFHDKVVKPGVPRCLYIWRERTCGRATNLSLAEAIRLFSAKQCANPKDRVFGVLGMVHADERIDVDYELSVVHVFYSALLRALEVVIGQDHPAQAHRRPVTLDQIKLLSGTFDLLAERMGILSSERDLLRKLNRTYQEAPDRLSSLLQEFRTKATPGKKRHPDLLQGDNVTTAPAPEAQQKGTSSTDEIEDVDDWLATYQKTMAGLGAPLPIPRPRSPSP